MFRIGSIFIPVSDVEQSLNWYTTYFHAQEIGRWEGGIGICLPDGSTQIGLIQTTSTQPTTFKDASGQDEAGVIELPFQLRAVCPPVTNHRSSST